MEIELVAPPAPEEPETCMYCDKKPTEFSDKEHGAPFALCDAEGCRQEFKALERAMADHSHQAAIEDYEAGRYIKDGQVFEGGKPVKPKTKIYQIAHCYEHGGDPCLIQSSEDPTNFAVSIQLKAELNLFEEIHLLCTDVVDCLVKFFGFKRVYDVEPDVVIDLYNERESRCGDWFNNSFSEYDNKIDDKGFYDFIYRTLSKQDRAFMEAGRSEKLN